LRKIYFKQKNAGQTACTVKKYRIAFICSDNLSVLLKVDLFNTGLIIFIINHNTNFIQLNLLHYHHLQFPKRTFCFVLPYKATKNKRFRHKALTACSLFIVYSSPLADAGFVMV